MLYCFLIFAIFQAISWTCIYSSFPLWITSISKDLHYNVFRNKNQYSNDNWKNQLSNYNPEDTIFITGSTGGIGKELVKLYKMLGNKLILHTSSNQTNNNIHLDFTKLETLSNILSIQSKRLDNIIHNAGLMSSKSNVCNIHCVNCIAPFILTLFLLPNLFLSNQPKIIFIGSSSYLRSNKYQSGDIYSYIKDVNRKRNSIMNSKSSLSAYATSKYNLMLLSIALQYRLQECNVTIHTIHPGLVDTPMLKGFFGSFSFLGRDRLLLTPKESAIHVLHGIYNNNSPINDIAMPSYIIRGKANKYQISKKFGDKLSNTKLLEEANICYNDMINIIPYVIRKKLIKVLEINSERIFKTSLDSNHRNAKISALQLFIKDISI